MYIKKSKLIIFFATIMLLMTAFYPNALADENNEQYGDPGPYQDDITQYYNQIFEPRGTDSYVLYDNFGGYWCDAEKLPPDDGEGNPDPFNINEEDDLLCWAATAANILEWTGWGFVGSMENTDDFLDHYEDHWYDRGGWMDYAWHWWFDGTDPGDGRIDVAGAGNYWPGYTYSNYYHVEGNDPDVPERIHDWLELGYGCGIGIFPPNPPGGHAITVWGIEWDTDDDDYYVGMWVTDSDSHKNMNNPPDVISYIQLEYDEDNTRWYMPNYGNWWISEVQALEPFPDNTRPIALSGGPYIGYEATPVTFTGSAIDPDGDTIEYRWDFENDGIWDTAWSTSPTQTHTWNDDYTGEVKLEVYDGRMRDVEITTVTIHNVAPSLTLFVNPINENDIASLIIDIDDPSPLDTFTVNIDWNDGTSIETHNYEAETVTATETHQYLDDDPTITPSDIIDILVSITDDDGGAESTQTSLTINNVNPIAAIENMVQPNAQFILPKIHELDFTASYSDVGTLDTHVFDWDFGDGNTETGTVTPSHTYDLPGTYTVTMMVTDDDTGWGSDTYELIVVDQFGALQDIDDYIQNLPDDVFKGNATNRKNAFHNMFLAIYDMLVYLEYQGAISELLNNIREKSDGLIDGKSNNDWITDLTAQTHICMKIDDLTSYLEILLNG